MSEQGQLQAEEAGLVYVEDGGAGYSRRRCGRGFAYLDAAGKPVRDPATVRRLRSLVVPPAWTRSGTASTRGPHPGHRRDAKGRKQYRYHDDWSGPDDAKFDAGLRPPARPYASGSDDMARSLTGTGWWPPPSGSSTAL